MFLVITFRPSELNLPSGHLETDLHLCWINKLSIIFCVHLFWLIIFSFNSLFWKLSIDININGICFKNHSPIINDLRPELTVVAVVAFISCKFYAYLCRNKCLKAIIKLVFPQMNRNLIQLRAAENSYLIIHTLIARMNGFFVFSNKIRLNCIQKYSEINAFIRIKMQSLVHSLSDSLESRLRIVDICRLRLSTDKRSAVNLFWHSHCC